MEEMSGDAFGPVCVDYFHGRRVERVDKLEGIGAGEPVWTIVLSGGGLIENFDPTIPAPMGIVGAGFNHTIMESGKTSLRFGLEKVDLNPTQYAIVDPRYTRGYRVYAQRSDYNMPPVIADNDPRRSREAADDDGA